jgi:hypothetical protein
VYLLHSFFAHAPSFTLCSFHSCHDVVVYRYVQVAAPTPAAPVAPPAQVCVVTLHHNCIPHVLVL